MSNIIDLQKTKMQNRIMVLKTHLHNTDYKAIKFAEGEISQAEYEPTRELRRQWRAEINVLEEQLKAKNNS